MLTIVYSLTNNSDIHYSFVPHTLSKNKVDNIIVSLPGSNYGVSIYVVIESGLPFPRAAVQSKVVWINGNFTPSVYMQPITNYLRLMHATYALSM